MNLMLKFVFDDVDAKLVEQTWVQVIHANEHDV